MAERARPGFVFDQHRGGAASGIGADRLLHGERIAIAGVAIGQPQQFGRCGNDGLDRVGHFRKAQQIHVGHRQTHRRDARARDESDAEAGFRDQPGAHCVAAAGHDLKSRLIEKRLHCCSLRTHGGFPFRGLMSLKLSLW